MFLQIFFSIQEKRNVINSNKHGVCDLHPKLPNDLCVGSCNTLNDLFNKACITNKTEDLNLRVFSMIAGINESKTLTKHISWECKCKFDTRKCNSNQWWNNNKRQCGVVKIILGILVNVVLKMENI